MEPWQALLSNSTYDIKLSSPYMKCISEVVGSHRMFKGPCNMRNLKCEQMSYPSAFAFMIHFDIISLKYLGRKVRILVFKEAKLM